MNGNDYKWFFESPDKKALLKAELDSWEGTPYKHLTGVKQRGCDCIHLVVRAYEVVGANKGKIIKIPYYAPDWHIHRKGPHGVSLLIDEIKRQFDCEEIKMDPANLINGDIVLFKWGFHPAHSGIYWDGQVYQALTGLRVERRVLSDIDFYNRMEHILRIKA